MFPESGNEAGGGRYQQGRPFALDGAEDAIARVRGVGLG